MPKLSQAFNTEILIKREDQQECRSFKIRGAYNRILLLSQAEKECGIICASAGTVLFIPLKDSR